MSENQSRRNRDFTQYDAMTTEALEEILRLDAEAPEARESDTELLLYIMEVLANRRNTNNTGKTALEAWETFKTEYLPVTEECFEHTEEKKKPVKVSRLWLRRMVAAAAVMALLLGIPVAAEALNWGKLWNAVAEWTKETFSFVSGEPVVATGPSMGDDPQYTSLQQLLAETGQECDFVPTRIPDGYILDRISIDENPERKTYFAFYTNGTKMIRICVQSYLNADPEKIEVNRDLLKIYEVSGIKYYIFSNNQQLQAVWIKDSYECYISGELTVEEIKTMINSIGKG